MTKRTAKQMKRKGPAQQKGQMYQTFEEIPEITPAEMRHAALALIGSVIEYNGDPICGLEDVLGALGLMGSSDEQEEERPQEARKGIRRNYTKAQSAAIMSKVAPDAELAKRFGRTVTSIINHREHMNNRPRGTRDRFKPE